MNTEIIMHPLNQKEMTNLATRNGIYGTAALLLLNMGILFWTGGLSSFTSLNVASKGSMFTTPKQNLSNPFENLLFGRKHKP